MGKRNALSLKGNKHASGHVPWNKGLEIWTGDANPRWGGGRYVTTQGYVHVLRPGHPRANGRGYVPEQVVAAETKIGRALADNETVHHFNGVKSDNRPENLIVMEDGAHRRHHAAKRGRSDEGTFN